MKKNLILVINGGSSSVKLLTINGPLQYDAAIMENTVKNSTIDK